MVRIMASAASSPWCASAKSARHASVVAHAVCAVDDGAVVDEHLVDGWGGAVAFQTADMLPQSQGLPLTSMETWPISVAVPRAPLMMRPWSMTPRPTPRRRGSRRGWVRRCCWGRRGSWRVRLRGRLVR